MHYLYNCTYLAVDLRQMEVIFQMVKKVENKNMRYDFITKWIDQIFPNPLSRITHGYAYLKMKTAVLEMGQEKKQGG